MKLEDIRMVKQVTEVEMVNKMIMEGWIIIKIFHQTEENQSSKPMYIMGKMKE